MPTSASHSLLSSIRALLWTAPLVMAVNPTTLGVLVSLYAIGYLALCRADVAWASLRHAPVPLILLFVTGLGLLSSLWAVNPDLAVSRAWKFLLVMLPLALLARQCLKLPEPSVKYCARALIFSVGLAAVLLVIQIYEAFLLAAGSRVLSAELVAIKLNVPVAELAIIVWCLPLCLKVTQAALGCALVVGLTFGLTILAVCAGDGLAPRIAMGAGALIWLTGYFKPRTAALVVGIAVIAAHVFALAVVPTLYRDREITARIGDLSISHRLEVWDTVGTLIHAQPWLGYGLDNSRAIPASAEISEITGTPRRIPLYPHTVPLQAQLELGIAGVLGFYSLLFYLLKCSLSMTRMAAASALAMLAAGMSIWCVGYPLWRSAWIAWLGFCAIAISAVESEHRSQRG
ncbi:MAG: O-antigen ligase family protein [Gammaproteobacteria bacterium]|nr:O-antigen ligase family protein [Gammaproteobacteria bacterium]